MRMISDYKAVLPLTVVLCFGEFIAAAQTQKLLGGSKHGPFTEDYGKHVNELLEKWHVPGLAIGVVDGDHIWTEGYGIATLPDTPVTSSTLFYCASTSKAHTAAAMSMIIESGNYSSEAFPSRPLDYTTPINDIIPDDFVLMDEWATRHITIEDAFSHRTGMPRHDESFARKINGRNGTIKDIVRSLRYLPLKYTPRTTWNYNNHMYAVVSHIIETLTSRWLGDVLKEWIWQPLGMNSTYFSLEDALSAPEHFAGGYSWDHKNGNFTTAAYMTTEEISGAGAIISNVVDYTKWVRALLYEAQPIPKAAYQAFKTPRMFENPADTVSTEKSPYDMPPAYAFGWSVTAYRGHRFWKHDGGMHAYGAEVYFFPDLDFGVVTFANTAVSSNALGTILVWELVDDRLGVPKEERHDWAARFAGWERDALKKLQGAVDQYYPDRPKPGIAPSRPIGDYTGTYYHPGYQNMTLKLADAETTSRDNIKLVAKRPDMTWQTLNEFEHVTGEYWMMYANMLLIPGSAAWMNFAPAEFKIGADGKVEALGISWISGKSVDALIWFDRVE